MTVYTIIATAHHVDDDTGHTTHVIPYTGPLTREAITDAICVAVVLDYSIADGDCTDQEAYEPDLADIKIDSYVLVAGQVQEVTLP